MAENMHLGAGKVGPCQIGAGEPAGGPAQVEKNSLNQGASMRKGWPPRAFQKPENRDRPKEEVEWWTLLLTR